MNDLDLMSKFRADVDPPEPVALARARAGMFRDEPPRRRSSRWVWRLAPAGALVAAVAIAAVVARPASDQPAPPVAAESEAVQVLRLAAAEARQEPVLPARPGQFVYVQSRVAWSSMMNDVEREARHVQPSERERRIWLSVDGSADGLLREGPDFGDVPLTGGRGIPAYRADLPTDAKAMRTYLYEGARDNPKPGGLTPDDKAWIKIGDTLREQYVRPASVAALFDAAATIPGTSVIKGADLVGRRGTAVVRTAGYGLRYELIFDAKTHRFLGERTVAPRIAEPGSSKGEVTGFTAQLKVAIVDRPGQLP